MQIIAAVCSVILIMEFILHGIAMLIGMEAGVEPLTKHFGFRPHRALVLLIGVVDMAVAAAMVAGFWRPSVAAFAAGYAVLFFGLLLFLRFHRDLGTILRPPDFPLFFTLSVLLLVTSLMR